MTKPKAVHNYATGTRNGMVRDADEIVRRARALYTPRRCGYARVANLLSVEVGRRLHNSTVRQWINGTNRRAA